MDWTRWKASTPRAQYGVGFREERFLDNERERMNSRSASRPVSFANERREVGGRGGTGRFSLRSRRFQMDA